MVTSSIRHALVMVAASLLLAPLTAASAQIYKCKLPNGVLSFQEKPCARGTHLKTIVVPTVPAAPPPPSAQISATPAPADAAVTPHPAATASVPPAPPPLVLPPAPYYQCTRGDGSTYYTASPLPRRYEVAANSVTDPATSLGPASPGNVWMEERCAEVPLSEACAWYQQQLDFVIAQQRVLSGIELKRSVAEQQRLTTIRSARCRGQ
jgi:hypothetical protein